MSLLAPLLEVQELDLEADRRKLERENLPERDALKACGAEITNNDQLQAKSRTELEKLARDERQVAGQVSTVAADAEGVEGRLYSGEVTAPKELEALQEELRLTRGKQNVLEEAELEIMEAIEAQESKLAKLAEARTETERRGEEVADTIRMEEARIDAELEALAGKRRKPVTALPAGFIETYSALREKPRLAGRASAALVGGLCQGCRVSLPRMDLSRILAEPEEAQVECPHCARLLVR
ncbi:MAG: hypothetical protein OSB70_14945 [Myxococcota bacterium]|nr:hypothetical protein [Myxococcota bacterium]